MSSTLAGLSTFPMIANRRRPGTVSRRIWRRLVARSVPWLDTPVMFEPGRARLSTRPVATGSPGSAKTIGTLFVACFAARAHAIDSGPFLSLVTGRASRTTGLYGGADIFALQQEPD